eukprot:gene10702-12403_t
MEALEDTIFVAGASADLTVSDLTCGESNNCVEEEPWSRRVQAQEPGGKLAPALQKQLTQLVLIYVAIVSPIRAIAPLRLSSGEHPSPFRALPSADPLLRIAEEIELK